MPQMVLRAAAEHGLDLAKSFFVGDKDADVQCGKSAGTRTILVETGYGKRHLGAGADHVAKDVVAAVEFILKITDAE